MFRRDRCVLFLCLALLAWTGCGDDGGGFNVSQKGLIELDPNDTFVFVDVGITGPGGTQDFVVRIKNLGQGPLTISDIALNYSAPDVGDDQGTAFELDQDGAIYVLGTQGDIGAGTETSITVRYTRQASFAKRSATLVIRSDSAPGSDNNSLEVVTVTFEEQAPAAVALVTPPVLDFGAVANDTSKKRTVKVNSTGSDDLIVTGFALIGHPGFAFIHPDTNESYPVSEVTATRVQLEDPITVKPNETAELPISFSPTSSEAAKGTFVVYANDIEGQTNGHTITLVGNENIPCIHVNPKTVLFGPKIVGIYSELTVSIENCGSAPLSIKSVALGEASDEDFTLVPPPIQFSPDAPLALPVNEALELRLGYVPSLVSPLDADNKPIPDTATLLIDNNSFEPIVEVPITGIGVDVDCPVAIVNVAEGEQVIPQTTLHLKGDQSYSPGGLGIKNYEWSLVAEPPGNTSIFIPSATHDNPVYTVNVAGQYTFCLTVRDDANEDACEPACIDVIVIPDEAIHVELFWSTATDEDPEDTGEGKGTDMDLHFAHPFATGPDIDGDGESDPWFDENFDCFWFYKTHNWGTFDPAVDDDPSLDRDDIDGWGPENLNLNIPENAKYRIGVHYWDAHDFGPSNASIRIYIYGEVVAEVFDVPMVNHDFWNVGIIDWQANGNVETDMFTNDEGAQLITPNYLNAKFLPPQ